MPTRASAISEAKLLVVEGGLFGGGLKLDELAGAGHHDVHVDFGLGVLLIAEVQHGNAADYADAGGGYVIANGIALECAELH